MKKSKCHLDLRYINPEDTTVFARQEVCANPMWAGPSLVTHYNAVSKHVPVCVPKMGSHSACAGSAYTQTSLALVLSIENRVMVAFLLKRQAAPAVKGHITVKSDRAPSHLLGHCPFACQMESFAASLLHLSHPVAHFACMLARQLEGLLAGTHPRWMTRMTLPLYLELDRRESTRLSVPDATIIILYKHSQLVIVDYS